MMRYRAGHVALAVAIVGTSAVLLGAFGSHGLQDVMDGRGISLWETAVGYHFWHALAFTVAAVAAPVGRARRVSLVAFLIGIVLFCGSLYLLALGAPDWFGVITPVGGIGFIVGWLALAHSVGMRSLPGSPSQQVADDQGDSARL